MWTLLADARQTLTAGIVIAAAALLFLLLASAQVDLTGMVALLARALHVIAAMIWVGLVVFVNFVQFAVLAETPEAARADLAARLAPRVAWWYRHASTVTVATGAVLLATSGYVLAGLVYGADVGLSGSRATAMAVAVAGALAMWMFVHMYIWPALQVVLGLRPGDAAAKNAARERVQLFARANLLLAMPVTVLMVAAAHAL
jgi:uncharacterized membrane protein